MIRIRKFNLIIVSYILFATLFGIFFLTKENVFVFGLSIIGIVVWALLVLLQKKYYLMLGYYSLVVELFYAIAIKLTFISQVEDSWRKRYNSDVLLNKALRMQFLAVMVCLLLFVILIHANEAEFNLDKSFIKEEYNILQIFFVIMYAVITYWALNYTINTGLRDYTFRSTRFTMLMAIFRICQTFGIITIFYGNEKFRHVLLLISTMAVAISFRLSFKGYRYLLVEVFLLVFFLGLSKHNKLGVRQIVITLLIAIGFYFGLVYVKAVFTNRTFSMMLFNHERGQFYTLCAVIKNLNSKSLSTYYTTALNILPKALTGSRAPNSGQMLVRYITYETYKTGGYTMGAYFLTEAFANFHYVGVAGAVLLFPTFFYLIERGIRIRADHFSVCMYFALVSQIPTIVYYGSSNYIKFLSYYLVVAFFLTRVILPLGRAVEKNKECKCSKLM